MIVAVAVAQMSQFTSTVISPDQVRGQTSLAPLLLQTEGLTTDMLVQLIGKPVTTETLEKRTDRIGFVRWSVLRTSEIPLYIAATVVAVRKETRSLIRDLQKEPHPVFGELLKLHGLYGRKTAPQINRAPPGDQYRRLFGVASDVTEVWERTYAVLSPAGWKVAGITEIFSPKLEELLRKKT